MPEYRLGILAKAQQLGKDVVGDPLEDEHEIVPGCGEVVQMTTRGRFVYSFRANHVQFYTAAGPAIVLPAPVPPTLPPPQVRADVPSPYFALRQGVVPTVIILHSTRSGAASNTHAQERDGTTRWFESNPYSVSAHYVVGDNDLTPCVQLEVAAQHAGYHNLYSIGIELTQPVTTTPYTEGHYRAAAECVRRIQLYLKFRGEPAIPMRLLPVGSLWLDGTQGGITGHDRSPQGRTQGKSDPGPLWDWDKFMGLVQGMG